MAWTRYREALRGTILKEPALRITFDGRVYANGPLVKRLKLDEFGRYNVFVDNEAKAVGLVPDRNGDYSGTPNKGGMMLPGVRQAMVDLGCQMQSGAAILPKFAEGGPVGFIVKGLIRTEEKQGK